MLGGRIGKIEQFAWAESSQRFGSALEDFVCTNRKLISLRGSVLFVWSLLARGTTCRLVKLPQDFPK